MKKNKTALQLCRKNEIKEKAAHYPRRLCINFRSIYNVFQRDINKYTTTTTLTNYPQLPWFAVLLMIRTLSFIILTPWLQKIISNALNKCRSRRVRCFDLKGKIPFSSTIADLRSEGNSLSQHEPVTDQITQAEAYLSDWNFLDFPML